MPSKIMLNDMTDGEYLPASTINVIKQAVNSNADAISASEQPTNKDQPNGYIGANSNGKAGFDQLDPSVMQSLTDPNIDTFITVGTQYLITTTGSTADIYYLWVTHEKTQKYEHITQHKFGSDGGYFYRTKSSIADAWSIWLSAIMTDGTADTLYILNITNISDLDTIIVPTDHLQDKSPSRIAQ